MQLLEQQQQGILLRAREDLEQREALELLQQLNAATGAVPADGDSSCRGQPLRLPAQVTLQQQLRQ